MQSSFKSRPPSFIEEIQRDLRATTMQANHIIFMGYSLPQDDVTYRAFFSASRQRHKGPSDQQVRCTVVSKEPDNPGWYGPAEMRPGTLRKFSCERCDRYFRRGQCSLLRWRSSRCISRQRRQGNRSRAGTPADLVMTVVT